MQMFTRLQRKTHSVVGGSVHLGSGCPSCLAAGLADSPGCIAAAEVRHILLGCIVEVVVHRSHCASELSANLEHVDLCETAHYIPILLWRRSTVSSLLRGRTSIARIMATALLSGIV